MSHRKKLLESAQYINWLADTFMEVKYWYVRCRDEIEYIGVPIEVEERENETIFKVKAVWFKPIKMDLQRDDCFEFTMTYSNPLPGTHEEFDETIGQLLEAKQIREPDPISIAKHRMNNER